MTRLYFPKNFLWGAALSAEQSEGSEGQKAKTIYDIQFQKNPNDFIDNIGPQMASNVFNKYLEDVKLYKELSFNSFRTSFSWARLFPNGMDSPACKETINYYHNYINSCKKNNIDFIGTLFHFDLPEYEFLKGGWESEEVVNDFVKYADFIFAEFGEKINMFVTMNEPFIPAINGYINGRHFPNVKDIKRAVSVAFSIILAHARVVNLFNAKYKNKNRKIGCIFDARLSYPISNKPKDLRAAQISELLLYKGMTNSMILGAFDISLLRFIRKKNWIPKLAISSSIREISKIKLDFYGINYYAPLRVAHSSEHNDFHGLFKKVVPNNARVNSHRGIEIYPKGLYDIIKDMANKYKLPLFISENGIGIENEEIFRDKKGKIDDKYRIAFIKEHLEWVHKAIKEEIPIFGYHLWASIDNWSWINSYKNRYGLIEVNLKTQERNIKSSGYWFKKLIKNNYIQTPYEKIENVVDFNLIKSRGSR